MMNFKTAFQTAALVVTGIVLALVVNAFASRDRKMTLAGSYPNALTVPMHETAPPPPSPVPPLSNATTTTTIAPASATATTATEPTATAAIETVGLNPAARNPTAPMSTAHTSTAATSTPTPHSPLPTSDVDPLKRFPPHPDKPYVEIAFADVKWLHDKNALFLDARRTSVFEQGHIPGARPYSVWESDIDDKVKKLFDERSDPGQQALPIVIYCSGGDCEDSHMLAQKLWGIQFNNLSVYKDGFPDWQQHGEQIHTGANP
jgi:rhodanese-related sulfurtransferase